MAISLRATWEAASFYAAIPNNYGSAQQRLPSNLLLRNTTELLPLTGEYFKWTFISCAYVSVRIFRRQKLVAVKVGGGSAPICRVPRGRALFFLWSSSNRNDIEVHNGPTSAASIPSPHPRNLLQHSRPARYPCPPILVSRDTRHLTRD